MADKPDFMAFIRTFHPNIVGNGVMYVSTHAHQAQWMSKFTQDAFEENKWYENESKEDATSRDTIESSWSRFNGQWIKTHIKSHSVPSRYPDIFITKKYVIE